MLQSEGGSHSLGSVQQILSNKSLTPLSLRLQIIAREIRVTEFNISLGFVCIMLKNIFANAFLLL